MNPAIATLIFLTAIGGLFFISYDKTARVSPGLCVPTVWFLIASSRAPSAWLTPSVDVFSSAGQVYLEGNPFERNLYSALLFLAIVVLVMRGARIGNILKANSGVIVFILYCLVSLIWSDYPSVGFKRWTKLVGDVAMVLIVLTDRDPAAAFERLLTRTGLLLLPLSILISRYFPVLGRQYDIAGAGFSWTGVATNKNTLGMVCMILGVAACWRLLRAYKRKGDRRRGPLYAQATVVAMVFYLFHYANSATSQSCFWFGSALVAVVTLFKFGKKTWVLHLFVAGAIGISVGALFFNFGDLLHNLGRNSTLTGRTDLWNEVLSIPVDRMRGAGYESFWLGDRLETMRRLSRQEPNQAHNGYIEILINLGWIGIAFLGWMVLQSYRRIMAAVRKDPETHCLRLAYFMAMLIYNCTEAAFKMSDPIWIIFLWATMAPAVTAVPRLKRAGNKRHANSLLPAGMPSAATQG